MPRKGPTSPPDRPTWAAPVPSRFSSPAVGIDRTIYVGSQGDGLVAINPDGTIRWRALHSDEWVKSSPAIARDGTIYIGLPSGEVHAIAPDGSERWSRALDGAIAGSPAVGSDGTVYIGALNTLYALAPDGRIEWSFQTLGQIFSSPAVGADGTVYVGSEDGGLYALAPDSGAPGGARSAWGDDAAGRTTRAQTSGGVRSSPLVTAGTVYAGSLDHSFYAFDRGTGRQRWRFAADSDIDSSSALGPDGTLYIASLNGTLYALDPAGHELWSRVIGGTIEGSPSMDRNGIVYVGSSSADATSGHLYAIDPKTGDAIWKLDVAGAISSSPVIGAEGTLYVGSGNALLLVGAENARGPGAVTGDVNGDGRVNLQDATLVLEYAVGLAVPSPDERKAADLNRDGQVTVADATLALALLAAMAIADGASDNAIGGTATPVPKTCSDPGVCRPPAFRRVVAAKGECDGSHIQDRQTVL